MSLPGFAADAALGPSHGQYRCATLAQSGAVHQADLSDFFGLGGKKSTAWGFVAALPGAIWDTFSSGEAYQSYAQGQQAAVHVLTFGAFGDPEARARELAAQGYQRADATAEPVSRGLGTYVIGPAVQTALFSWAWAGLGRPTMNVAWYWFRGRAALRVMLPGHAFWGVGGRWVHAWGNVYREMLPVVEASGGAWRGSWTLTGIPVLFPTAVVETGGKAYTCVTAVFTGFLKGWFKFW
jgi:hypothetical protein